MKLNISWLKQDRLPNHLIRLPVWANHSRAELLMEKDKLPLAIKAGLADGCLDERKQPACSIYTSAFQASQSVPRANTSFPQNGEGSEMIWSKFQNSDQYNFIKHFDLICENDIF